MLAKTEGINRYKFFQKLPILPCISYKNSQTSMKLALKYYLTYLWIFFFHITLLGATSDSALSTFDIQHHPELNYQGFKLIYDCRLKIPLYTYEILTPEHLVKLGDRNLSKFQEDPLIADVHQSKLTDYFHSGYDRGHMVPAADQAFSQEAMNETFYLTNICPQNADLNRHYWMKLEKNIRGVVRQGYIVETLTGPLFLPYEEEGKKYVKYEVIGANNVAVPTHFFKLIKIHSGSKELQIYIIPNMPIPEEIPLEKFEKSLEAFERISGLQLIKEGTHRQQVAETEFKFLNN